MRSSEQNRRTVRIISWVTAICLLGDSMLYIVLPVYWASFGLQGLWQVGILLSINRMVRLPLNPLVGWAYSWLPKRTGILIAVVIACLTTLAFAIASGFWMLLIARAAWGAAWSMLRIGGYLTVLEVSTEDRGHLLGSYNGIIALGSLVGMLAGGVFADLLGVRMVALVLSIITALGFPLAWLFTTSHETKPSSSSKEPTKQALRRGLLHPYALLTLCSGLIIAFLFQGLLNASLSSLIDIQLSHRAEGLIIAGFAMGAASIAGVVQALRWGWTPLLSPLIGAWSDGPRGRLPLYFVTLVLAIAGMLFLSLPLPFAAWMIFLIMVLAANTALNTLSDALAADAAAQGTHTVAYMTTYTTILDVGAALGPLAAFTLIETYSTQGITLLSATMLLLLSAAWFLLRRHIQVKPFHTASM
ncbi:MFS transporter [Paenibacillus aquistagni]|uniref:Predicted arabinose efflux permease, MFS family n=1 Tax=Paenibacillus aquistagni TaxID=1852522 RepID=A0A1X7IXW9_9BACL|nr:MFS transporter [Paenibacillus aquistagni]SMG19648.1 Predicted arabinose efflux permease, MFS family [Paenibacillus aquistagni]